MIGEATQQSSSPTRFYTSEAAMARHFEAFSRRLAFDGGTADAAWEWQTTARQTLHSLLGLDHFTHCTPDAALREIVTADGLRREEWLIRTEEDVWMPFSLLIPEGLTAPAPLVICTHGHGSPGRLPVVGRRDLPEVVPVIDQYRYDYGVQFARAGCITACPDARGFGERREPVKQNAAQFLESSCHNLMLSGAPLGITVQGMWTWDLMRLIDFLVRDERISAERIGCGGLSGGGLQTLDLAAIDERVRAAVVSGYFYGVQSSLQVMNGNCDCNLVPGLWGAFDIGDIGALIAPRGLFVETGSDDSLNGASGVDNVRSQLAIAARVFDLLGGELQHDIFTGGHRWHGERAVPWLVRQLNSN